MSASCTRTTFASDDQYSRGPALTRDSERKTVGSSSLDPEKGTEGNQGRDRKRLPCAQAS